MVKIEVLKDEKGFRIRQVEKRETGEEMNSTSGYMKANVLEDRLWEMMKMNRMFREERKKVVDEELKSVDELFDSMSENLCEVGGVKVFDEYKREKLLEWLDGMWKYEVDKLGSKKEMKGVVIVNGEEVSGVGSSKVKGRVVETEFGRYGVRDLFGKGVVWLDVKREERDFWLGGFLDDGREVKLVRKG